MGRNLSIEDLTEIAKKIMPKGSNVWLYGSRARGDAQIDSDWDILVLMDKDSIVKEDFDKISYPLIEYGWRFGADLSPQIYTKKEWDAMRITPYYKNVEHDKKIIYEFLAQMETLRDKADYNIMFVASEEDVLPNIPLAESFIKEIEKMISE